MIGTYVLVLIGPGSVVALSQSSIPSFESLLIVALVFGAVVAVVILLVGPISGAIINPALTLASGAAGLLKSSLVLPYVVFQVAGALAAGLTLEIAFGGMNSASSLGSTKLASGISSIQGTALEIGGTFVLALSALTAATYLTRHWSQAILVGTTLFLLILLVGPLTGASFNPARSLGPSLFSGYFQNQVVYYIGPLIGGSLAGLAFNGARNIAK